MAHACAGDESLRREVLALLDQPTSPAFLDGLTPAAVAQAMGDEAGATMTGRRFGPYLVHERIGAGGMGEVYRARDSRLGRDVAIKVLPPAFANDADRLARFEREARVLASLDHPHIGTIHGVEESAPATSAGRQSSARVGSRRGRYVGGSDRTRTDPDGRGARYARQIADALEAAHDKGVIHRDLKPGNIKITPAGLVKYWTSGSQRPTGCHRARHSLRRRTRLEAASCWVRPRI